MEETANNNIQDRAYGELTLYAEHTHQICRWILRISMIMFFVIPIFLITFCVLSGGDKVVTLIIWIVLMFVMALVVILLGYFDHRLNLLLSTVNGDEHVNLELIPTISGKPTLDTIKNTLKDRPTFEKVESFPDFTDIAAVSQDNIDNLENSEEDLESEIDKMLADIISERNTIDIKPEKVSEEAIDAMLADIADTAPAEETAGDDSGYTINLDNEIVLDNLLKEESEYAIRKKQEEAQHTAENIMSDLDAFVSAADDEDEL